MCGVPRLALTSSCPPGDAAPAMLIFRWTMMLLMLGVVASMVFYVATGEVKYRNLGLKIVKWAVLAAAGFFGVLILERLL